MRVGVLVDRPADWQFAMCDVGQGDATLARSDGLVMLVDTGPEPEPLAECLGELGVGRIDLLVLTHYDLDHVGGVDSVAGRVERVLVGPVGRPRRRPDRGRARARRGGRAAGRVGDSARVRPVALARPLAGRPC